MKRTKKILTVTVLVIGFISFSALQAQDVIYNKVPADPAHIPVPEAQRGEVIQRSFSASSIYPGTKRDYWVYVPKAYTPEKPACLFVCLDGIAFDAPTVFDNLIPKGDMPVTIAVFVAPGAILNAKNETIHWTRQYEYDTMDDTYVRFLTEELLPDVEKQTTSDGRLIRISKDGNDLQSKKAGNCPTAAVIIGCTIPTTTILTGKATLLLMSTKCCMLRRPLVFKYLKQEVLRSLF
jgi:hypothetical protein